MLFPLTNSVIPRVQPVFLSNAFWWDNSNSVLSYPFFVPPGNDVVWLSSPPVSDIWVESPSCHSPRWRRPPPCCPATRSVLKGSLLEDASGRTEESCWSRMPGLRHAEQPGRPLCQDYVCKHHSARFSSSSTRLQFSRVEFNLEKRTPITRLGLAIWQLWQMPTCHQQCGKRKIGGWKGGIRLAGKAHLMFEQPIWPEHRFWAALKDDLCIDFKFSNYLLFFLSPSHVIALREQIIHPMVLFNIDFQLKIKFLVNCKGAVVFIK